MSRKSFYDFIILDKDECLLDVYKAGSVISYISMLMNIVVFGFMFRKSLLSPATILIQGLATADFLTAFSTYGFEPLFQTQYHCRKIMVPMCSLPYPYCSLSHHLSILSFTFHNVSYLITTCLGIQKVIAILFPIWTKFQLTNKKSVICCTVCFLLSITISIPRHFSYKLEKSNNVRNPHVCYGSIKSKGLLEYSSLYYLITQTVLMTCCCLVMLMSAVFISYKLTTNKFRGRMTEQRRQERRSVIMVIIILVVFLITEVPKVILNLWWCYNFIACNFYNCGESLNLWLVRRYEGMMPWLLVVYTDLVSGDEGYRLDVAVFIMEGIKLFTIVGCISNFIIYIVMSTKMRNEIILLFRKCLTAVHMHKKGVNQIDRAGNNRTQN
ncbi:unnamed protein product [Mytilus edulis]|uniref:G-protein coupled receptors family 1 profile domain-containing protein n=1 Tax=Mytilus edulis TaxID=6550 RepID=A0A8S3TLE8_MYTED|nr:unnamed protein product [Mytilus edulis]